MNDKRDEKKQKPLKLEDITQRLKKLEFKRFHGDVLIKYYDGKITGIDETLRIRYADQLKT